MSAQDVGLLAGLRQWAGLRGPRNAPQLSAIRADGQGDVTASHIVWTGEDGLPDTCSPLATPQYVFLLTSAGMLTCYDAKTGKKLWEQDFEATFKASPSLAGKYVYLVSDTDDGKVFVVEPGPTGCKRWPRPTRRALRRPAPPSRTGGFTSAGRSTCFASARSSHLPFDIRHSRIIP